MGIEIEESETGALPNKLTVYRTVDTNGIYYQLKHAKPVSDYGSKLQVFSKAGNDLTITCKTSLFSKSKLKMEAEASPEVTRQIEKLAETLSTFKWMVTTDHLGWPESLRAQRILKFETPQIDLATSHLDQISQIHSQLASIP